MKNKIANHMKYKEQIMAFLICTIFCILGTMLCDNEIYEDDWYIEASADGLFGEENRSLMVLCSNFIITGIIKALSLSGVRLMWLHIIFVALLWICSLIICNIIISKSTSQYRVIYVLIYMTFVVPILFFNMQLTIISTYVIISGCANVFYCIDNQKKWFHYFLSAIVIILGVSIRDDNIYFALVFMGSVWLYNVFHKRMNVKGIIKYAYPFVFILMSIFLIFCAQRAMMSIENGGFYEWNTIRSKIDDYDLPKYDEAREKYEQIGINENDYELLKTWNYFDSSFYTEEKYQQLLEICEEYTEHHIGFKEIASFWIDNIYGEIILIGWIIGFALKNKEIQRKIGLLMIISSGLIFFFMYKGRWIWRIEWSIILAIFISLICIISVDEITEIEQFILKKRRMWVAFSIVFLLFFSGNSYSLKWNPLSEESIINIYFEQMTSNKTYWAYIQSDKTDKMNTTNKKIEEYLERNKDLFFFPLFEEGWLQHYPLVANDIFLTSDVGACENWGTLGQYMINLQPIKNNFKKYGIENPIKDLCNKNARVIVRNTNIEDINLLEKYLEDHYYEDVKASVVYEVGDACIYRFVSD